MPVTKKPNALITRWFGPLVNDPHLLHINRHSVSTAVFIGLFTAFLPVPAHMLIVTGLALVFRCNLPISILLIWISNPVTIPPMVIALYKLGEWMLGNDPSTTAFVFTWEWLNANLSTVYWPILLAGLSCGLIFGMLGYFTVRILWRWKVVSNWETRKRKRLQKLLYK